MADACVRRFVISLLVLLLAAPLAPLRAGSPLRVAVFRCDVTPALGQPLIWTTPAAKVADALWAKGIIIENGRERYVLCALDWCGVGGGTYQALKEAIAAAAGTDAAHVALQSVHQHTAPYVDGDGYGILSGVRQDPPLTMAKAFLDQIAARVGASVRDATRRFTGFDAVGTGTGTVAQVASARRIAGPGGAVITRYSGSGKDPAMAALPEGDVDSLLRTVTLSAGGRPLVRLHYYATHPQTFCCEGTVSGDFVSVARERLEREEGVPQIYFTGCSGDITVGKYNDGTPEARAALGERLYAGMRSAIAGTRTAPASDAEWHVADLRLPLKPDAARMIRSLRDRISGTAAADELYRASITLAFMERETPLAAGVLRIGSVRIVHLPGEPMLEFQRYAQALAAGDFVAVAGYGDMSPGYLCTDRAFIEGGYEPGASNAGPGTEARVKETIRNLLGRTAR